MPFYKDRVFQGIFCALAAFKLAAFAYLGWSHPLGENILAFPDSLTYIYPAQTFLQYGHMWEAVSVSPMLLRTPGYPFFLALIQLFTGNLTWAVAAVQNVLSLFLPPAGRVEGGALGRRFLRHKRFILYALVCGTDGNPVCISAGVVCLFYRPFSAAAARA